MNKIVSLLCGIVFGIGLVISEMINPMKVKAFLDITGNWDPSLIFVMIASISVLFFTINFLIKKVKKPILAPEFNLPSKTKIDKKLILGSCIFGIGLMGSISL